MLPFTLLLRFRDKQQAVAVLTEHGVELVERGCRDGEAEACCAVAQAIAGDGVLYRLTNETAEFEGERIQLTTMLPGYHLRLRVRSHLPDGLASYLVVEETTEP